jgi:putative oxidoreductase
VKKWYLREIWVLDGLKHSFLLLLRLYFGWGFMSAGLGKLLNVRETAELFAGWDIPLPTLTVYLAGTTEAVCGGLLLLGAASRIITIPLIGTMLVAYLTAHTEQFKALFDNETRATFFKAPPFPYLFTCLVVLFFGPGLVSVDGALKWLLQRHKCPAEADSSPMLSAGGDVRRAPTAPPDASTFSSRGER